MAPPDRKRFTDLTGGGRIPSPFERQQREQKQMEAVRNQFFGGAGRDAISDDRAFRRFTQDRLDRDFKQKFTKPVMSGNPDSKVTGLVQMSSDAPRTLSQERQRIANIYGPTPGEIAGDAMRAIGNIGQQAGFIPFVSGAMKIGEGIKDFAQKAIDFGKQFAPDMGGVSDFFRPAETDLSARILALSPTQRQFYDRLVSDTSQNISVQEALRRAEAIGMAMGGIATLQ